MHKAAKETIIQKEAFYRRAFLQFEVHLQGYKSLLKFFLFCQLLLLFLFIYFFLADFEQFFPESFHFLYLYEYPIRISVMTFCTINSLTTLYFFSISIPLTLSLFTNPLFPLGETVLQLLLTAALQCTLRSLPLSIPLFCCLPSPHSFHFCMLLLLMLLLLLPAFY